MSSLRHSWQERDHGPLTKVSKDCSERVLTLITHKVKGQCFVSKQWKGQWGQWSVHITTRVYKFDNMNHSGWVSIFSQLLMTGYKNTNNHYTMLQGGKTLKNYQGVYHVVITLQSMTHKMCRGHIWGARIAQWWSTGHVIKRLQVWVLAVSRIFFSRD